MTGQAKVRIPLVRLIPVRVGAGAGLERTGNMWKIRETSIAAYHLPGPRPSTEYTKRRRWLGWVCLGEPKTQENRPESI